MLKNGLFRLTDNTVYPAKYILAYNLNYRPRDVSKTIFGTKAVGTLTLTLKMALPKINNYNVVIGDRMTADGYYNAEGEFVCGFPKIAIQINDALGRKCRRPDQIPHKEYRKSQTNDRSKDQNDSNNDYAEPIDKELIKAMSLFMIDDLSQTTESDLRSQRNRLIKTFHPDSDMDTNEYAQKINEAYEILKGNLLKEKI